MMTITHYNLTRKARTSAGAIRSAKSLIRVYGQGNKNPVIDCSTQAEADDLEKFQRISRTSYPIRLAGVSVA